MSGYDDWGRSPRRDTAHGLGYLLAWAVGIALIVGVVSAGVWYFGVATSDVKGRGDATKVHNSATNRIFAQQHFEDLYAGITDRDVPNLKSARAALKRDPHDQALQTNMTGVQQICNQDVADYNASARKFLERDFKAADLPPRIDPVATCE
jgi:hypothetical protein